MATKKLRADDFGSVEEFKSAINLIAEKILAVRRLEVERDKAVQKIVGEKNVEIEALTEAAKAILSKCDTYAKAHREDVFPKGAKTSETELCTYFLRLGAPALKPLNAKWKESDCLEALRNDPAWRQFIVVKESIDKDRIKAKQFTDVELAVHGFRITQTERLTVEPKVNHL